MSSLYQVLLFAIPFVTLHVAAHGEATALEFVYPKQGNVYEFAEGDEVVVQWEPRVQLSKVFLNCSSKTGIEEESEASELEFINAYSGVLYYPRVPKDGNVYCTFCAGPDAKTCSGVFHLSEKCNSTQDALTSKPVSIVVVTKTDYKTECPESTTANPTASQITVPEPSSPTTTSLPPLLTFGAVNSSAPTWTVSLPPAMSLPPYVSVNPSGGVSTIGIAPSVVGTGTAPYTTITIVPQGWNTTGQATNSSGISSIVETQPTPPSIAPTPSFAPPPTASVKDAGGSWSSTVDFALFGLFLVGAGAFVML